MASSYDDRAASWDSPERIERTGVFAEGIRRQGAVPAGARIQDFGAGSGLLGYSFLKDASALAFVDSSGGMRKVLAEKASSSGRSADILIVSSLDDPALRPASFDAIVTSMAMHHVKETAATIARFADLLKRGGRLCIVDLQTDNGGFHDHDPDFEGHHGFEPEALSALCAAAGFRESFRGVIFRGEKALKSGPHPYELFLLVMERSA